MPLRGNVVTPDSEPEKIEARPEKRFENKRRFLSLGIMVSIFGVIIFIFTKCGEPINVRPVVAAASGATPTIASIRVSVPIGTPVPVVATPSLNVAAGALCRATLDIDLGDGQVIPQDAQVMVRGYTQARGGMVSIVSGWFPESFVSCGGVDLHQLERVYVVQVTPTSIKSVPVIRAVSSPVVVVVTATPGTSVQPNGLIVDNGCVSLNLVGVKEIWVDGRGVSNGRYCGMRELRIVFGVAR